MRIDITDEARGDLREIGRYIAQHNQDRAVSFVRELVARCYALAVNGHRYLFLVGREQDGVRRCFHRPYLIFYTVDDQRVEIMHILHSARDYRRIMFATED